MIPVSDVLTLIFVLVDDVVKSLPPKSRPGPEPILSDGEMVTLLLLKELCGVKRDREWLRFVRRYWSSYFPALPSWGRFCRRAQACHTLTETVRQRLVDRLERALAERGEATEPRRVDSTGIEAVEWARSRRSQYYAEGEAAYGYKSAQKRGFFGFRLHLLTNTQGVPLVFGLCPADVADITALPQLVEGEDQSVVGGDNAYWSAPEHERLYDEQSVLMMVPPKRNQKADKNPTVGVWTREARRAFNAWRQRIESVIKMLKDHMNLEDIFARSTEGFFVRVHRKVTALTLGMWVNLCLGREILHVKELLA